VPETSLVDGVLDRRIRERPEWQGYLCGVNGALPSTQGGGLKALRPHLGDLEIWNVHLSSAPVLAPAPMALAAATETAAEARISRLGEALRRLTSSPQARRHSTAGPTRSCHRCGSPGHLVRHRPHPPLGANPTRPGACPALLHGGHWLLDSGTTHDMRSVGKRGASAFRRYHAFDEPVIVQFGKRGAMAPAIGLRELVVLSHAGHEVLDGVLHVPDLVVSLFSVRAALARGMAVHFCPGTSPDAKKKV
jgi:hypothetical protein